MRQELFPGRTLLIVTKHKKEKAITEPLETALGVRCVVTRFIDTDALGTFTGEINRKFDPVTTARDKCLLGIEKYDADLAIASEGSFGPHPQLLFVPTDEEVLYFIDRKNKLEIVTREITLETNFDGALVENEVQLHDFLLRAKFPSHGVILRKSKEEFSDMTKGINDWAQLTICFNLLLKKYRQVYIETDMRAMYNPTRMKVIGRTAQKLAERVLSHCPACNTPGFGITEVRTGLPCKQCGIPTRGTLSHIYQCQKCLYARDDRYPNRILFENPEDCDQCNP